jgi:hypothetical protein
MFDSRQDIFLQDHSMTMQLDDNKAHGKALFMRN